MQISHQSLTAASEQEASRQLHFRICEQMDRDIAESGLSREQVADRMGVSIHQLNAWLAPGRQNSRFPCVLLSSFCDVTGSDALKRLLLGAELCELLELGERAAAILDARARRRLLQVPRNPTAKNGNASCAS